MLDILQDFKAFIKSSRVSIDNNFFSLHYRLTVIILVIFCSIIGSRKYFGDPIVCTADKETSKVVDNFCWFNLYIIVPRERTQWFNSNSDFDLHPQGPVINEDIRSLRTLKTHPVYKARYLHIYQWIEFLLCFQAVIFFIPRYLWRYVWENGRVKTISEQFSLVSLKVDNDKQRNMEIVRYFKRSRNIHFEYAVKYVVCEILNFANVLTQFLILRRKFRLDMETLLRDFVSSESNRNFVSPVNRLFPNMARCEVPAIRNGTTVLTQHYCVLPLNIFTTKIYIFLWFYFLLISSVSGIALLYRISTILSLKCRSLIFTRLGHLEDADCSIANHLSYGDWLLLSLVGRNVDPFLFGNLIKQFNNDETIELRPCLAVELMIKDKASNPDVASTLIRRGSEVDTLIVN